MCAPCIEVVLWSPHRFRAHVDQETSLQFSFYEVDGHFPRSVEPRDVVVAVCSTPHVNYNVLHLRLPT